MENSKLQRLFPFPGDDPHRDGLGIAGNSTTIEAQRRHFQSLSLWEQNMVASYKDRGDRIANRILRRDDLPPDLEWPAYAKTSDPLIVALGTPDPFILAAFPDLIDYRFVPMEALERVYGSDRNYLLGLARSYTRSFLSILETFPRSMIPFLVYRGQYWHRYVGGRFASFEVESLTSSSEYKGTAHGIYVNPSLSIGGFGTSKWYILVPAMSRAIFLDDVLAVESSHNEAEVLLLPGKFHVVDSSESKIWVVYDSPGVSTLLADREAFGHKCQQLIEFFAEFADNKYEWTARFLNAEAISLVNIGDVHVGRRDLVYRQLREAYPDLSIGSIPDGFH